MRIQAVKLFATAVLSTAAFAFASGTTEVEACCGLFNCLFGWCGGCGGCGPRACYRPSYPCAPSGCSPCASTCSPCGTVACAPCSACSTGDCSIGSSSTNSSIAPAPEANDNWQRKRTYAPGAGGASGTDLGEPGRPAGSGSDADRLQGQDTQGGFQKPVRTADDSEEETDLGTSSNRTKPVRKSPPLNKADDGDQGSTRPATINLDEKVAWRTAPARTRVDIHPRVSNARLVRLPAYPKSDWIPVADESKIASN